MDLKQAAKAAAGWCYLLQPFTRRRHAEGMILMLHRVIADDRAAAMPHRSDLCLGRVAFERLLGWLNRHFDCVPLMELLEPPARRSGRLRVALTFDDGWRDNATHAFPLLQRHQTPASIFLSTDFIGSQRAFWWESIGETLWNTQDLLARDELCNRLQAVGVPVPPGVCEARNDLRRSQALARYLKSLKQLSPNVLQTLADHCPHGAEPQAMDWPQIQAMEASGLVRFGPHGASHSILTQLDGPQLERELRDSSASLRQRCRQPLPVYCYPNGDHNEQVRRQLTRHSYGHALSTRRGLFHAQDDRLALPRIGVSQDCAQRPSLLAWRMLQGAH